MTLKDLDLKPAYDSDEDDVLHDFYIPVLSQAVRYRRLAGFFSSTSLAVAARGIGNFIQRQGHMELIASAKLTREDAEAIRAGTLEPNRVIAETGIRDLSDITDEFVRDHVRALAWMVANRQLDIKVAIHVDNKGAALDEKTINERGIFHQKVGVIVDDANDMISFSGSINETAYAWLHNIEEFKVFRSWGESFERGQFEKDLKKINKYMLGKARNAIVIDVPTAIRDKLISMAPRDITEIDLSKYQSSRVSPDPKTRRSLRGYQVTAVDDWKEADFKGIISMATGTGKTLVALRAVELYVPRNALTIIVVPFGILAGQWMEEIVKEFPNARVIECDSSRPNWVDSLGIIKDYVISASTDARPAFVVTTYNTASSGKFAEIIDQIFSEKLCLVADEVHHAGAPVFSNLLKHDFKYRLGLSATPERMWDEGGQQKIMDFFQRIVFEFSIEDALAGPDPVLCPYEYHIHAAVLKDGERNEYSNLSSAIFAKITQILKRHPNLRGIPLPRLFSELSAVDSEEISNLQILLFRRNNILKKASGKLEILREILASRGLGRCLIYCNDLDHLNDTLQLLQSLNMNALKYDSTMSTEERKSNLDSFSSGVVPYLVAVKCLDEGVDIPTCDSAILVASSKSEREFIQRRGRLLRKDPSKAMANIHDIVVVPVDPKSSARTLSRLEFEIINAEFERSRVFAASAKNSADILLEITRLETELASKVTAVEVL